MKILKKIDSMGIFLRRKKNWFKQNIGLPEILIATRHLFISLQSWPLSLFLIKHFSLEETAAILFVSSTLISYVFLKISDRFRGDWFKIEGIKNEEEIKTRTILIKILVHFAKRKSKSRVSLFLFFTEPLLFVLYFRKGHHQYDGIPSYKVWLLFLLSSLTAAILWATLMTILSCFGIYYFALSGIITVSLISIIYFIK